jgi:hypothetical protein
MLAFVIWACSENQKTKSEPVKAPAKNSDKAAITAMINEYFDRVMEGDKTVLYENEFPYYTDEHSLDDYMEFRQVLDYKYDTLAGVNVDSIHVMGDSALLWVNVHYAGKAGTDKERPYLLKAYRCRGRWLRPYLSHWEDEAEYEEQIRQYDSAVAAEEKNR